MVLERNARVKLFNQHTRLACKRALQVAKNFGSKEDLIQEALCFLWEATGEFDPALGNRFSTFVYNRLKGHLQEQMPNIFGALNNTADSYKELSAYREMEESLTKTLNRKPTDEEVMICMGFSPLKRRTAKHVMSSFATVSEVEQIGQEQKNDEENKELINKLKGVFTSQQWEYLNLKAEGLKPEEICEKMGITEIMYRRLRNAVNEIRKEIQNL